MKLMRDEYELLQNLKSLQDKGLIQDGYQWSHETESEVPKVLTDKGEMLLKKVGE